MSPETGQIYQGIEIQNALDRGESVIPVSQKVAELMAWAQERKPNRRERRAALKKVGFFKPRT